MWGYFGGDDRHFMWRFLLISIPGFYSGRLATRRVLSREIEANLGAQLSMLGGTAADGSHVFFGSDGSIGPSGALCVM